MRRGIELTRPWSWASLLLLSCLAAPMAGALTLPGVPPAMPAKGSADRDSLGRALDKFETTDWDSAFAAYDRSLAQARRGRLEPLPRFAYSKAQGLHLEMGLGYGPILEIAERVEGRFGYDLARERPTGAALVRLGQADPLLPPNDGDVLLGAELEWHEGARAFGDHDPYGNTLLTAVGGYDARQYLRERGGAIDLLARVGAGVEARVGVFRREQDPLPARADWHLFGEDRWMASNLAAKELTSTGLHARFEREPALATPEEPDGTYFRAAIDWWQQGALNGEDWARLDAWFFQHGSFGWRDAWAVTLRGATTGGERPPQSKPSLGGQAGLRGFRPWSVVGDALLYGRAQYELSSRGLKRTHVPLVTKMGLELVPYAEWGVVRGANRGRADLGFGLRHSLVETGQATHAQVDFAWPIGRESGPVRVTFSLSNDGLD